MAEQQPQEITTTKMIEEKPRKEGCSGFCRRLFRCKRKKNDKELGDVEQPTAEQVVAAQADPVAAAETSPAVDAPAQVEEVPTEQAAETDAIAPVGMADQAAEGVANLPEGDSATAGEAVGERTSKIMPVDEEQRPLSIFIQRGIEDAQRGEEEEVTDLEEGPSPVAAEELAQTAILPADGEPSFAETAMKLGDDEHPFAEPENTASHGFNQSDLVDGFGGPSHAPDTEEIEEPKQPEMTSGLGDFSQPEVMSGAGEASQPEAVPDVGESSQPEAVPDVGESSQLEMMPSAEEPSQPGMVTGFGEPSQAAILGGIGEPSQSGILSDIGESHQPEMMSGIGESTQPETMPGIGESSQPETMPGIGESSQPEIMPGIGEASKPDMSILQPDAVADTMEAEGFTHPEFEMADKPAATGMEGFGESMQSTAGADTEEKMPVYSEAMQGVSGEEAAPGIAADTAMPSESGTGINAPDMPAEENSPMAGILDQSPLADVNTAETVPNFGFGSGAAEAATPTDGPSEITPITDALDEGPPAEMQDIAAADDDSGEAADGVAEMAQSDPLTETKPRDKKRKSFLQQMFAKKK